MRGDTLMTRLIRYADTRLQLLFTLNNLVLSKKYLQLPNSQNNYIVRYLDVKLKKRCFLYATTSGRNSWH